MSLASKANTLKEQLGLEDGLPIVAIVDQAAVQLGITEEAGPLPIVEKCDLCLSELGNPRQPVSQEAAERCAEISKQLGYAEGTPLAMVVSQAETDLGLGGEGLDLVQRCNRVCETLGIGGSSSARPALAGPIAPVPATMAGEIVVLEGIAVTTPEAPASLGVFTFSSCTNNAFDTNGVLYALGTDFGRADYTNPADSGKVRLGWSSDAANYYSTAGGHKLGDATQAARIICAHTHPGANATMWSRGEHGAWFSIDLVSIELRPTHFAYRNDYGGGGNHPRSFELQGSSDGRSWSTLSVHSSEGWSGKQAKAWPLHGHSQYYRMLRIQNKGAPKHLCCSGIEFYGEVRPAPAAPPPPSGSLRMERDPNAFDAYRTEGCYVGSCCVPILLTTAFCIKPTSPDSAVASGVTFCTVLPIPWSVRLNRTHGTRLRGLVNPSDPNSLAIFDFNERGSCYCQKGSKEELLACGAQLSGASPCLPCCAPSVNRR